jgi:hypothetical protein
MSDRLFYPLAAVAALLMIALALVWPQGYGLRSPGPFGGPVVISETAKAELRFEAAQKAKAAEDARKAEAARTAAPAAAVAEPAR